MIKACVFDIGNVLVRFCPETYITRYINDAVQARILAERLFYGQLWKLGDLGQLSRESIIEYLCCIYPKNAALIREILVRCDEMLEVVPENALLLKKLKAAKFSLYYLSNTNPEAFAYMNAKHAFFRYFDGGIASFREKLLKPDPEIFIRFLDRYDLNAGDCVFCDDMAENTATARGIGFLTVTLASPEELQAKLAVFPGIREVLLSH